ncbi:MAG: wax ester/triacylglycerol synthase family O-acyltransferase [Pseudonocardia sp.]
MSKTPLGVSDALFLYAETRETPMHVGGLTLFTAADGTPADHLRLLVYELRAGIEVAPPWNRRLETPWLQPNPVHRWVDTQVDLDYHVRRTAVPSPGDERELGVVIARLHTNPLDLSRPPWEMHLIEGLSGGRFAIYVKIHHALVDGYTGMKLLARSLSADPEDKDTPLMFTVPPPWRGRVRPGQDDRDLWGSLTRVLRGTVGGLGSALELGKALTRLAATPGDLVGNLEAPPTILNRRITRNRRFATQQYPLSRLKEIAAAAGCTLNDVVLAVCGGGLRTYLTERDALPDRPLVAFLPVNVRPEGDPGGGVAVGAILASMGTDLADPAERLAAVARSTTQGKRQLGGMSPQARIAYSAALLAPALLQSLGAAVKIPSPRLTFNVTVSNVPGPREPLYFRGARMDATYPLSIPIHGVALNITLQSYAGTLDFGFIGCRDTVPHLQRLAVQTGDALDALEAAVLG